jgi:hypothetical protein
MTTTDETPKYRVRNRPTTTAAGGIVHPGDVLETNQPPNQFFEPINVAGFQRCVAAGFDPTAWGGPEPRAIAEELRKSADVEDAG